MLSVAMADLDVGGSGSIRRGPSNSSHGRGRRRLQQAVECADDVELRCHSIQVHYQCFRGSNVGYAIAPDCCDGAILHAITAGTTPSSASQDDRCSICIRVRHARVTSAYVKCL